MTVAGLLSARMTSVERAHEATDKTLQDHITDCSKMQKRVLGIGCLTFIWIIVHSPEAAQLTAKAFEVIKP